MIDQSKRDLINSLRDYHSDLHDRALKTESNVKSHGRADDAVLASIHAEGLRHADYANICRWVIDKMDECG